MAFAQVTISLSFPRRLSKGIDGAILASGSMDRINLLPARVSFAQNILNPKVSLKKISGCWDLRKGL